MRVKSGPHWYDSQEVAVAVELSRSEFAVIAKQMLEMPEEEETVLYGQFPENDLWKDSDGEYDYAAMRSWLHE